jgi:hypothetical protein
MKEGKPRDSDINNPRLDLEGMMAQARIEAEGATLPFLDTHSGKTSIATISEIHKIIGRGNFAEWVASVDVHLTEDTNEQRVRTMVLKRFKDTELEDGETNMERSVDMFQKIKAAGISTWTTYRPSPRNKMVLMTLGIDEDNNKSFITYNDPGAIIDARLNINPAEIDTMDLSSEIDHICDRAAKANIFLTPDSFGYIFQNDAINVIISDFDMIDEYPGLSFQSIYEKNVEAAKKSIAGVFRILENESLRTSLIDKIYNGLGMVDSSKD